MRRQLISYDAFDKITKNSMASAVNELIGAEDILADVLDEDFVELHSYDQEDVYYETSSGTYIHANYEVDDDNVSFENMEEVAIDTDSFNKSRRGVIADMMEAVWNEDEVKATDYFRKYTEAYMSRTIKLQTEEVNDLVYGDKAADPKKVRAAKEGWRSPGSKSKAKQSWRKRKTGAHAELVKRKKQSSKYKTAKKRAEVKGGKARVAGVRVNENANDWYSVANNVLEYVGVMSEAPVANQVSVKKDDLGNVSSVSIPTGRIRNEGKLLALKWDTLKTDVQMLREKAHKVWLETNFQDLVLRVKRLNNLSDQDQLVEALDELVTQYPVVLYLTQNELAKVVSETLATRGAQNFDDQVCEFIAEGILRVAFNAYPERVNKLAHLANAPQVNEGEDAYEVFQSAVTGFFPSVDEQMACEMQVFEDLQKVVSEIHELSRESENDELRFETNRILTSLNKVFKGEEKPTLQLAERIADYVVTLVETNLEMQPWNVAKTPYRTTVGEHPDMAKKAAHPYAPSRDFTGNWGGKLPVSDGKSYKGGGEDQMRNRSWGNAGGPDTYPSLNNPYIPDSSHKWTLAYEPGVDKTGNQSSGQWSSGDTWPSLNNPYVPSAVQKHVNNDNKVDDVVNKVGLNKSSDLNQKVTG